ncbi:hypothetical protein [Halotia branconii]|uniref:Uncharacterized protein n=1 Tax=Halotia branconii CENA392 TaxID=1539056 RepID=A0AAJ6P8F1_9CYAN|nr:hypothetical protein [Halotia branconii]WGV24719.1 hypothetical protein QI031_23585 [Halotia branconii CENA392]
MLRDRLKITTHTNSDRNTLKWLYMRIAMPPPTPMAIASSKLNEY